MPYLLLYTFLPPMLNKPVHGLLETGRTIRTHRIVVLEKTPVTQIVPEPASSYFATTSSGSRYSLILLPMPAFNAWLADFLDAPPKEVISL